jgi:hypothetical protein
MNDLDMLRTMRADAPSPAQYRLAAGRERLRAAASPLGPGHRLPGRATPGYRGPAYGRPAMILASGLAVGALAAAAVLASRPAPSAPHTVPSIRLVSATQVLDHAASVALATPALTVRPHQWVYEKGIKSAGTHSFTIVSWSRFDGQETAFVEHGKLAFYPGTPHALLATPQSAAGFLASLPTNPAALLAIIYKRADAQPRDQWISKNRDVRAFSFLIAVMWNAPVGVPPEHQAAAFRALAKIPGVAVRTGRTDAAGRPAIGLALKTGHGLNGTFLLDPHTYTVSGLSYQGAGVARLAVAVVDTPGRT